jgi:hypothetical protein
MPDEEALQPVPEWVTQLIAALCKSITAEDVVSFQAWHEEGAPWHVEIQPTLYQDSDGDFLLRGYNVNLSAILKLFQPRFTSEVDVTVEPEEINIFGEYEGHKMHVIIDLQPNDEDYEEVPAAPPERSIPN